MFLIQGEHICQSGLVTELLCPEPQHMASQYCDSEPHRGNIFPTTSNPMMARAACSIVNRAQNGRVARVNRIWTTGDETPHPPSSRSQWRTNVAGVPSLTLTGLAQNCQRPLITGFLPPKLFSCKGGAVPIPAVAMILTGATAMMRHH